MEARVDLFASRETSHCPLWFSLTHPAPLGLDAMVQTVSEASSVCIFPDRSASGSPGESSPGPGSVTSHCPAVTGQSMVPRFNIPSRRASSGALRQEGPSVPSRGLDISTPNQNCGNCGLGLWGGSAHRLRSLSWGCWDHSPIQSSFHEETLCLEVESFYFMV